MTLVIEAGKFAKKKHSGQKYGDRPYYLHCFMTYRTIKLLCPLDFELQAAALLHDTLEDTDTTYPELVQKFGLKVADLVREVTKSEYNTFPHLETRRGVILKFADRLSNLVEMDQKDSAWQKKYIEKSKFWKS